MVDVIYLVTSLPSLTFGDRPKITLEDFDSLAEENLSVTNLKKLKSLNVQKFDWQGNNPLQKFATAQESLRKDLLEIRRTRREDRVPVLRVLSDDFREKNPLDRETTIALWQWKILEDVKFDQNFTLVEVMIYRLQLQLLWRIASFDVEQGNARLAAVVTPKTQED